jgi:hypothetical protein
MTVGPNWKPHVYTDAELDRLEREGRGTLEDLGALLCRAIKRMPAEEKAELRASALARCDRSSLRLTMDDVNWLRKIKINPYC